MNVNEINDISTDNLSTSSLDVNNLDCSDELSVGENNFDHSATLYAISKRSQKITKVTLVTISIIAGTALVGVSIGSLFVKNPPSVSDISHLVIDNHVLIDFTVTNTGNNKLYLTIYKFNINENSIGEIAYQGEYSSTNTYHVELELAKNAYRSKFLISNNFDYLKELEGKSFDFQIN